MYVETGQGHPEGIKELHAKLLRLQIWADKEVTVISVNDEITITAQTKIELIAGQSSVTLEGSNIEFKTPGEFTAKGALKAFLGGGGGTVAALHTLPSGTKSIPTFALLERNLFYDERLKLVNTQSAKLKQLRCTIELADGSIADDEALAR